MKTFVDMAVRGTRITTNDGKRFLLHPLSTSYVADLPETKALFSPKREGMTVKPCYVCLPFRGANYCEQIFQKRTAKHIIDLLRKRDAGSEQKEIEKWFGELSMHPMPPVLLPFPFVGIVSCVDLYLIFRVEPMHTLSLGIINLLKECVIGLSSDAERRTGATKTTGGLPKKLTSMRKQITCFLDYFLSQTENQKKPLLDLDFI